MQVQVGRRRGFLPENGAEGCIVLAGPDFGKVKEFDADEVHTGFSYCTARGLMVLEAQSVLLITLLELIKVVLRDSSSSQDLDLTSSPTTSVTGFPPALF